MRLQPILLLLFVVLAVAAGYPQRDSGKAPDTPAPASDISGMYTFLEEGEFVQITIEEQDKVTGFISRYGELPTDKGAFLDQFIKKGTLAGNALSFVTEALHGVGYEFKGTVTRGPGKAPGDESYYILKGTLTQTRTDAQQHTSTRSREVEFRSFPQDALPPTSKQD